VAAKNARRKGHDVAIGSFETIEPPRDSYNLVFLVQVLEHLLDPRAALVKIAGMLRPGGIVVIETPSTDCLDFRWFHRRYWGGFHFPRHFNLFARDHLERLVREAGLEPIGYRVKLQPVHWVWTAHHWLMEHGAPASVYRSFHIKNPLWLGLAASVDVLQVIFLKKSSNMQLLARKPRERPQLPT
jgi:SAM-dependent methyltransferase